MRDFDTNGLRLAEFQAKLFEGSSRRFDCSSKIFLRRFLKSNLLKQLDRNESSLISLSPEEALDEIENEFVTLLYSSEKLATFATKFKNRINGRKQV